MERLNKYIEDSSKNLDIDIVGFTDCEILEGAGDILKEKIASGKFTEFEENNIASRLDPKKQLATCRSIISIGISYNLNQPRYNEENKLIGRISKSSMGLDYHKVLNEKMEKLVREIKKIKGFNYKIIVDTSPLLDRELARKSGIGYFGKNCSLINKDYGSFIFLGHILTDLDLEKNSKIEKSQCGECRICLDRCPTGALESAYFINPKKCISYLTQTKNKVDKKLLEKMGNQIYGCDICQDVCPKNKGVLKSNKEEFYSEFGEYIELEELFLMSNKEFRKKYGHMAGSWRGRNIFKRNAIIALGNSLEKESLPLLYKELEKDDERFNYYIDWAISKIEGKG